MQSDDFEWDDAKAASNEAKHGVTFGMASDAFDDPNGFDWYDEDNSNYEHRYRLLGMVEGRLIFVAFTYRDHRVRIISAREADENEQEEYRIHNQG